ncbi:hypothetical protein GR328_04505 [Microvirga makkahensis]|uniref:Uncharacterized protein n=1 Tax=Microvirga makkahensis TaxID=1128670 RepID=A0A7X3MPP1_9HYPH|nr:hypothetical protein [Microvirga makkahensis]
MCVQSLEESVPTRLPPRPGFEAIEAAAPETASRRTLILALIGNISFSWSNNESMFIYVLMLLLDIDQTSAAIIFSTLNTTRARLDLVQRLAAANIADKQVASQLENLVERFNACTKIRNEFNHCMYALNDLGEITHTHSMKISEVRGRLKFGAVRPVDDDRLKEMQGIIGDLKALNRDLWNFLPVLENHVARKGEAVRQRG